MLQAVNYPLKAASISALLLSHVALAAAFSAPHLPSSPTLRIGQASGAVGAQCKAHQSETRRDFMKSSVAFLAGASLLGTQEANAQATFEEFMAEKTRKEKAALMRKAQFENAEVELPPEMKESEATKEFKAEEGSAKSGMDDYKGIKPEIDKDPLKTALVTILRVQEATLQESRLITTGNFKDLQRNNIKLATRMIIDNNKINDVVVKVSSYASPEKVSEVNEIGRDAVADLEQVLTYFEDGFMGSQQLSVDSLDAGKKEFILKGFKSCYAKLDKVLSYMPPSKVKAARDQVLEENELNRKELPPDVQILNPVFMN